jgi:hypothetical protein
MQRKLKLTKKNIKQLIKIGKIKPFYSCFEDMVDYRSINHSTFKYPLQTIILCITFAVMCGCKSSKSISRTVKLNEVKLIQSLKIESNSIPCNTTIDCFFQECNLEEFKERIYSWIKSIMSHFNKSLNSFSIDGKSMFSDVSNTHTKDQSQIYSVSMFSHLFQTCVGSIEFQMTKSSENSKSRVLVSKELENCNNQIELITSDCGNMSQGILETIHKKDTGYLFTVKRNTSLLYDTLLEQSVSRISTFREEDRFFSRTIKSFRIDEDFRTYPKSNKKDMQELNWEYTKVGLKRLYKVERVSKRNNCTYIHYYISNRELSASDALKLIKKHWLIETNLHGVKDMVFGEDHNQHNHFHTKCVMTVLMNAVISLFRVFGEASILMATEKTRYDFSFFVELIGLSGVAVQ